ncbi:MAG: porin [Thiogranum sp.]
MKDRNLTLKPVVFATLMALGPTAAFAASEMDELKKTVDILQKQLEQVQEQLKAQEQEGVSAAPPQPAEEAPVSRREIDELRKEVATAAEWRSPNTLIHMAGYSTVGYEKTQGSDDDGSFTVGQFAPIFHFQYRDVVMLEAELEFSVEDDGSTDTGMEYMTIDWFMNDYAALVAGKFLSPIGQFRQNLHPSWINKMASAPPGFGHDGAAPVSDLGVQIRGGYPLGKVRTNYALFVSNGPELASETEDGIEFELEGVDAEGFNKDSDGSKVFGGRLGVLPVTGLELGISGAKGKASVTSVEGDLLPGDVLDEDKRDYDVYGADFSYQYRSFGLRGEYVKTKVGSTDKGLTASGSANWETWYTQAAYRFLPTRFEAVVRYSDFDAAVDSNDQEQWAAGLNYLVTNNFIAKVNYEFNEGNDSSSPKDDNRFIAQLAYGF